MFTRVRVVLAVLIALFAVLTLLDRFVLIELLVRRVGVPFLFALAQAAACIGAGALLRRAQSVDWIRDLLIGYPILGAVCFLAGLVKISAWTMVPIVAIFAVCGVRLAVRRGVDRTPIEAGARPALLCVFVVLLCGFVAAQAPPSSLDEVAYHLAVPHTWVLEGRAVALPLLSHSWFPLGIESADLPSLALLGAVDGGITSHFLHLFAALATALLILRRTSSWLATAAIVTTPALAVTAGWALVDWPLAGLFVALFAADDDDEASAITAAGLLAKYTFIPFAILVWARKRKPPRPIALLGLVFFVRNLIQAGNPIAPFFSADAPHVGAYRALELAGYVFDGTFVDEALGASLLTLPILATSGLALACLACAALLFFLGPSSRILVPYLVVPAVDAAPALRRRVVAVFVAIAVVIQTLIVVWLTARSDAFSLLAGTATEQEYLRKARASYAPIEWLNETLPPEARALVIGSGESYWFARPVRGGGNFDGPRISRYLDVPAPEALRERLRTDGITHVVVIPTAPPTSVERKREERETELTPAAQRMLARTLDRYAVHVMSRGETAMLFTLK